MEFSSRGFQRNNEARPAQESPAVFGGSAPAPQKDNKGSFSKRALTTVRDNKFLSTLTIILSASLLILFIATIFGISFTSTSKELAAVDKENYQVVALSDGQAYFGKIVSITSGGLVLRDVYYLNNQSDDAATQSNIQLVKRGCEVHSPQDQMTIYRDQVNFWENLKADGRVTSAIQQWKEQNPEGQNCEDTTTTAPTQQPTSNPTETTPSSDEANESTSPAGNDGNDDTTPATNDTPADPIPAPQE